MIWLKSKHQPPDVEKFEKGKRRNDATLFWMDRNMILGKNGFFVSPSDSLAILADHLSVIPYFQKSKIHGLARSMPTSSAIDRVARNLHVTLFEVPTGWKYFGNLLDSHQISLCGEESFGTGSDHIREKDGLWAVLAWLSIIHHRKLSVEEIVKDHWKKYGRNYYTRYDYENCDTSGANSVVDVLHKFINNDSTIGKTLSHNESGAKYVISEANDFSYVDPVDNSVTHNQGIRVLFTDGSRIVFRLSGTGSSGATVRLYVEQYVSDEDRILLDSQDVLKPLVEIALEVSNLPRLLKRSQPDVIT